MNGAIVVVAGESSFAYFAAKLGLNVDVVLVQGKPLMGNPGNNDSIAGVVLAGCTALYWEMLTMCDVRRRHKVRSLLLIPHDSTRILDFNLKDIDEEKKYLITESLKCCDLMKIDQKEFTAVCRLLGLDSTNHFDNGFGLMSQFGIKTLILTHGLRGCHVFHGHAVSEKWGTMNSGIFQTEKGESAFLAAYYAASTKGCRLFSECHRLALDYMRQLEP